MKQFTLAMMLALATVLSSSQADAWWYMNAQVQINPHVVQGTVYNSLPYPIYCEGRVFGQVQTGQWLHAWMRNWVAPGTYQYVYVYANAPRYFINANSEIYCRH